MKSKITLFILSLLSQISFCQSTGEKLIHGKIVSESGNVTGVNIVNLVNEKSTFSDKNGNFYILAKAEDLLVFSSVNLDYFRRQIEVEDLKSDVIIMKMTAKVTELNEVVIKTYPQINAADLRISPKGIQHRTQMERRLYTTGDFKYIDLIGLLGGSMNVDAFLNRINGRTEMTKKLIKLENKIDLLQKTDVLFEDEYYLNTLKIPSDYIKGFQYYIIENEKFTTALRSKNKTNIEFLMIELAREYNTIISEIK